MTRFVLRGLTLAAALLVGCEPSLPQQAPPSSVVTAVFDPVTGQIPLPNDLALMPQPAGSMPAAQAELLGAFAQQHGFPNDQEVPVTISFTRQNIAADGTVTNVAPQLDVKTLTPATLIVVLATQGNGAGPVALDPIAPADYVVSGTQGTLTLHHQGRQPWTPGEYIVAVRGGANGVKTAEGDPIYASPVFYLIAQGQDLNTEQNLALLRAQTGSTAAAQQVALQLDALIAGYKQGGAFAAVNQVFPQQEMAAMTTFAIAPTKTQVQLDAGRGLVPLPIDLLRDPRPVSPTCAACGHLTPVAACTLAGGTFNAATGACKDSHGNPNGAATGFATLDGFSTTGMILAQTSDLVQAATVTPQTVQLYDLTNPAAPVKVSASTYLTEPCEITSSCSDHVNALSPVIALQPAGATAYDNSGSPLPSVYRTRPLKDNTDYAVVISDGVKDKAGNPLAAGTVAKVLQFKNALVDQTGTSQLAGIDNATAGALEIMRQKLAPTLAVAAGNGIGTGHVSMAYTFHTQSITDTAVKLAALPYSTATATLAPKTGSTVLHCLTTTGTGCDAATVDQTYSDYGISATVPHADVAYVVETKILTFNKLLCDPANTSCLDTGAFTPTSVNPAPEYIDALIALPAVSACAPTTPCTIPLVVFRHGLGGGRAQMLALAEPFTRNGVAVAAIDAAKHGDRSYCSSDSQCASGAHCVADPALTQEGDAPQPTPGKCRADTTWTSAAADFARSQSCTSCSNAKAVPLASSNFLVSANFFRTRDTLRQDIIDESQLVRVLSPNPSGVAPNAITTAATGVQFDPSNIWYVGQSLGAIQGTVDVAANPRFSKAVLNVGGGTIVDLFTTSPAFSSQTNQLLAAMGIQPGANSGYLQFLVVAKTILDPADPVNFAPHLVSSPLPNLFANQNGSVAQSAKSVLTQAAYCDQVVPNPFNYVLDSTAVGTTAMPLVPSGTPSGTGNFELFYKSTGSTYDITTCPAPTSGLAPPSTAVSHGFLLDFKDPFMTVAAQGDAFSFLAASTQPSTVRIVP